MIGPGMELHESEVADFIQSKAPRTNPACGPRRLPFTVCLGRARRPEKRKEAPREWMKFVLKSIFVQGFVIYYYD